MEFQIFRKTVDEAGNIGFVFDEDFEGTEEDCLSFLVLLNTSEGYEHVAEIKNCGGCRLISAPEFYSGDG